MEFAEFVEWAFYTIISGSAASCVLIGRHIYQSINTLNERVGILIEQHKWQSKEIEEQKEELKELATRVRALEIEQKLMSQ